MRSLHVITSDARRGAETFAVTLAEVLDGGDDHRARTVALTASRGALALEVPVLGEHRRSPSTLLALRRAARAADVVVAHGSSTLEACAVGLAGSGTPFVYRNIGDPAYWVTAPARRRAVGVLLRRATRVTALWPEAATRIAVMHRVGSDRIDVIPNAVAEERFPLADPTERQRLRAQLGVAAMGPCLAYVGALSVEKGVPDAIAAAAALPEATLLVAGVGPLERELCDLAERVARGRVRFVGQVQDPRVIYGAADLLLLPSVTEGMPAVLVEAGLVGTPTVGTAVGAVPTMIEDGVTGFLSGPPDQRRFITRVIDALPVAAEVGLRASTAFRGEYAMERVAELWRRTLQQAQVR
jgi:glycosyltransferase involved in cell wall biosynthesis